MLKGDRCESFNQYVLLLPKIVVVWYLDLSWPLHEASDSWNRKTAFPKAFCLLCQRRDDWIDNYTLWEWYEFAVSWTELRDLDDTYLKRDADLWSSNTEAICCVHGILHVLDDGLHLLRLNVGNRDLFGHLTQHGMTHSDYRKHRHEILLNNKYHNWTYPKSLVHWLISILLSPSTNIVQLLLVCKERRLLMSGCLLRNLCIHPLLALNLDSFDLGNRRTISIAMFLMQSWVTRLPWLISECIQVIISLYSSGNSGFLPLRTFLFLTGSFFQLSSSAEPFSLLKESRL